jgi:menaquinol-cytochrome c reductase cytochrome b/c subunit
MAETPEEAYERVLAEEQAKGSSPQVAQARAKAARMRTSKGLSTNPAEAAAAETAAHAAAAETAAHAAAAPPPAPAPVAEVAPAAAVTGEPAAASAAGAASSNGGEAPEAVFERVLAEEQAKGSSPVVAQARAKAARMRASRGATMPSVPAAAPPAGIPVGAGVGAAAAAAAQPAAVAKGRGSAARAARAASGEPVPERIQRLLAVVKPEAIQRVEKEPIDRVNTWPHLMASEMLAILVAVVFLFVISIVINAPFREMANINQTPNPSKAPWYFLGLQELLRYFHPQVAGVTVPQWIIVGLMATPFIDRNPSTKPTDRKLAICMFTIFMCFFATLVSVGVLFRGPGQNWVYPWKDGLFYLRNLDSLGEHGFEL